MAQPWRKSPPGVEGADAVWWQPGTADLVGAEFFDDPGLPGSAEWPAPLPHLGLVLGTAAGLEGTLNKSIGTITVASAGTVAVAGTLNKSIGTLTSTSAGTVLVAGALNKSIGDITLASVGGIGDIASLNASIGTITLTSAGTVAVAGTLNKSIGTITLATAGGPSVVGGLTATLPAITLGASGIVDSGPASGGDPAPLPHLGLLLYNSGAAVGTLNKSIGVITLSSAVFVTPDELPPFDFDDAPPRQPGYWPHARNTDWVQSDTVNRADTGGVEAVLNTSIGAITATSAGTVEVAGTLNKSIGTVTSTSAGTVEVAGTLNKSIGTITVSSAGAVSGDFVATLSQSIGQITLASAVNVHVRGDLARDIGAVTSSSAGTVSGGAYIGALNKSIGEITLQAAGSLPVLGTLNRTLEPITLSATGSVLTGFVGYLAQNIGAITLASQAELTVYELGVRRRYRGRAVPPRVGNAQARAPEVELEGELVE